MRGILAAGAAVAFLGGSLYLGLDGKPEDVGPVAVVEELRPVVLAGACVPPPGDEPLDECAEWICHDEPARDIAGLHSKGGPVCKAIRMSRPAGCVSQANSYEVDGKTLPGCLPEAVPGERACQFPAAPWLAWKAADDAHKVRLEVCREQVDMDGACLCRTRQKVGTVDGELADANALPAAARKRLVACPGKDGKTARVNWEKDVGEPRAGCVVAARPMVTVTAGDEETDLVIQLRAACAPCVVTGTSWGRCPYCLAEPGGCAEACR